MGIEGESRRVRGEFSLDEATLLVKAFQALSNLLVRVKQTGGEHAYPSYKKTHILRMTSWGQWGNRGLCRSLGLQSILSYLQGWPINGLSHVLTFLSAEGSRGGFWAFPLWARVQANQTQRLPPEVPQHTTGRDMSRAPTPQKSEFDIHHHHI